MVRINLDKLIENLDASPNFRFFVAIASVFGVAMAFPNFFSSDGRWDLTKFALLVAIVIAAIIVALSALPTIYFYLARSNTQRVLQLSLASRTRATEVLKQLLRQGNFSNQAVFHSVRDRFYVEKDGTTKCVRDYSLSSPSNGLHFFKFRHSADEGGAKIQYPEDIGFEYNVSVNGVPAPVSVVDLSISPHEMHFYLVFGEEVPAGSAVSISYSFLWKRYARDLIDKRHTTFRQTYTPGAESNEFAVECQMHLSSELGELKATLREEELGHHVRQFEVDGYSVIDLNLPAARGTFEFHFDVKRLTEVR